MSESTHEYQPEEVMAYLDGELSPESAANVALHMDRCVECRAIADHLRLVSQHASVWQVDTLSDQAAVRMKKAMAEQFPSNAATSGRKWRIHLARWGWALSSGLAALIVVVALTVPVVLRKPYPSTAMDYSPERSEANSYLWQQPQTKELPPAQVSEVPQTQPREPMIIKSASLTIVAKDFESVRGAVETIVRSHQGYIAQLNLSEPSGQARTLTTTLRVPSNQLEAAITQLKALGRVERESQTGEEVTEQYTDLVARISNSRTTEQRLNEIMRQRTGRVSDILAVEQEVARVRGEIERMEAERKTLENRVGYATVQLKLQEDHRAALEVTPHSTVTRLWNDLIAGIQVLSSSVLSLVTILLRYGPSLMFWILLLLWPARIIWRRVRMSIH